MKSVYLNYTNISSIRYNSDEKLICIIMNNKEEVIMQNMEKDNFDAIIKCLPDNAFLWVNY